MNPKLNQIENIIFDELNIAHSLVSISFDELNKNVNIIVTPDNAIDYNKVFRTFDFEKVTKFNFEKMPDYEYYWPKSIMGIDYYSEHCTNGFNTVINCQDIEYQFYSPQLPAKSLLNNIEQIYIRAIEGVNYQAPVLARKIDELKYEILNDNFFDFDDWTLIPEFQPGDIVKVELTSSENDSYYLAKSLERSKSINRKQLELQWKIVMEDLPLNQKIISEYKVEIENLIHLYKDKKLRFQYPIENWLNDFINKRM